MSSLDIPEAVTTSEQASRYLRSKTKDVGPLIVFAQALIDEKYVNLYFPRKEDFLMDWWFDRAEIGMKNDDFWQIFKKIWISLSADSKRQIYQRHKFLDTIKSALALLASDVTNNDSQKTERLALLSSIFDAVECVEQSKVWLRCTTEVMVSIVIDYLKLVSVFPEAASEKWCRLVFSIYENALYGVSNFKKISQSFSNNGLLAGFTVLKQVDRQAKLHDKLSNILRDLVFSPSVVKDDENQPFKKLCDVLAQIPDSRQDSDFLGHVLSLGLSKFGKTKQRSLMPKICEEFLNFAPQAARSILREAKNHDITISTQSLTKALHAQEPTDWSLATMILDADADAVFPMVEGLMDDKLRNSETSRDIVAFVCQLADSYTKIRNLQLFINIWRKTLTRGVPETSVMASEDLVRAVATRISENLTINQLNSIFVEIIPKDETGELMSGDILPLIAIILGTSLLPDTLADSLLQKAEKLLSLLNAEALQDNYLTWRLKYLILSMDKNIVKSVIESSYTGASDVASAVKSVVNPDRKVYDSRIEYFNLQMLFRIAEFKPLTGFPQVAQWLLDIMDAKSLQWDQNIANIGKMNLPVAFALCIIDRWLVLIEHRFEFAQVKELVSRLWNLAELSDELFSNIWNRLIASPILFEQVKIKDCVALQLQSHLEMQQFDDRARIVEVLESTASKCIVSSSQEECLRKVITSLLLFPIEALRRSLRERILDYLLLVDASSSLSLSLEGRKLIRKLLEVPNMTAIVQNNPAGLEYLVKLLNNTQEKSLESATVDIIKQVFKHSTSGDSQDKRTLLIALNTKAYNAIMQSEEQFNIGYIRLFSISSSFLEEIGGLDALLGRLVTVKGRIIRCIANADENDFAIVRSLVLSLREIYSLLDSESRGTLPTTVMSHVSVCIKFINARDYDTISSEICGEVVQALFELLLLSSPPDGIDALTHAQYVVSFFAALHDLSTKIVTVDGKMIQQLFIENAKSWSPNIYREIVDELVHIAFPAEDYDQAKYIEALACLITLDGSEHYEFLFKKLPLICCSLVLGLRKIASSKLFLKILNALESILKDKPSLVSQFVFEQISLFLVLSTSRSGPSFTDDYDTDELYLRLCSLTSTILLSFRKFLRGHHNLVIRLLQNLLYPLCVPRAISSNGRVDKSIQYHWKRAIWLSTTSACSTSCALAYSRLISNLCEPPSRSKTLSRKGTLDSHDRLSYSLSSAAGNSRRALSKHTPYLLVEYCYATLNYKIEPATRQALTQGIYTLFDSLGQNELKVVNAALDVAGRAIFKSVYDDYLKFGKWHEI